MFNLLYSKATTFINKIIHNNQMKDNSYKRRSFNNGKSLFQRTVRASLRQQNFSELYAPAIRDLLQKDDEFNKLIKPHKNSDFARIMSKTNQQVLDKIVYNDKLKQVKYDRINSYVKTADLINHQKQKFLLDYIEKNLPEAVKGKGFIDLKHKEIEKLDIDQKLIYELSRRSINQFNNHTGDTLRRYITSTNVHDTIYISIDIEEFELNHHITEIGITIYDPRENGNYNANGTYFSSQMPTYRKYHVIIDEEIKSRNSNYILCKKPESLFNETYILTTAETKKFLQSIWDRYFNNVNISKRGFKCALVGQSVDGDIKLIQKEFDIKGDFQFDYDLALKKVLAKNSNKILVYDTQKISDNLLFFANSVKKQLRFLNIPHGSLHNALNDSYFTLISFLTMTDIESRLNLKLDDPIELLKRCNLLNLIRTHPEKVLPMEVIYNIEESENKTPKKKWLIKNTEQLEYGIPLKTKSHLDLFQ